MAGKLYSRGDPVNLRLSKKRVNDTIMDAVNAASSIGYLNNYVLEAIELYAKIQKIKKTEKLDVKEILQMVILDEKLKQHKVFADNEYRSKQDIILEALNLLQKTQKRGPKDISNNQISIFDEPEIMMPVASEIFTKIENKENKERNFNETTEIFKNIVEDDVSAEIFEQKGHKKGLNSAFKNMRRKK